MAGERYRLIVKNGRAVMQSLGGIFNYLLGIKDVSGAGTVSNGIVDWTIQNRTKTTAEWNADTTTVLLRGQLGIEDTGNGNFKAKIGTGSGLWSALGYITGSGGTTSFASLTGLPTDNSALASALSSIQSDIDNHEARTDNPHSVTASQVGTYTTTQIDNKDSATLSSANTYTDNQVSAAAVGKLSDQGNYDASGNTFPVAANTNPVVATIKKGFLWTISVGGTLGGVDVTTGDVVRALTDSPGQTASNWTVTENNLGYVPENNSNKSTSTSDSASSVKFPVWSAVVSYITDLIDASGGIVGLTLFKINFRNAANTITSFFTNSNTASRTYTFPDATGNVVLDSAAQALTNKTGSISQWTNDYGYITAPTWTDFSSTINPQGYSSVTVTRAQYITIGKTVMVQMYFTGTSNATTISCTLPIAAANTVSQFSVGSGSNAGTGVFTLLQTATNSTTASIFNGAAGSAWTSSGTKIVRALFIYEGV